jgi:hypothetical protein
MILAVRRTAVVAGVVASLAVGAVSVRIAAELTAAAAPPTVPPVSIDTLRQALADEQARSAALEAQLADLTSLTEQLRAALGETGSQVETDQQTAEQLRARLAQAEARLAATTQALAAARARLAELERAASGAGPVGGGGGSTTTSATPKPTPVQLTIDLELAGGGVTVRWSACAIDNFAAYAVVRSTDKEVHWPPEDNDTEVARLSSRTATSVVDAGAPSGTLAYRVYCLVLRDGALKVAGKSGTATIVVP